MNITQPKIFSDLDFTALFLQQLKRDGIYNFNQYELEKEIYSYRQLEKFAPLFLDIDCRYEQVQLSEAISMLEIIGAISWHGLHPERKYIHSNKLLNNAEILNSEEAKLTRELADDYIFRKKETEKSPINLRISVLDPNRTYILSRGFYHTTEINWNLVTDAKKVDMKDSELVDKDTTHYVTNPKDRRMSIPLTNSLRQQINLYDATFAISQGVVNDTVECATLYSNSLDREKLKETVSYASLNNIENKDIKVYTIKR